MTDPDKPAARSLPAGPDPAARINGRTASERARDARTAEALRANLRRRKEQARGRVAGKPAADAPDK